LLPYRDDCHQVIVNNTQLAEEIILVTELISKELRKTVLS
jgi:uridine kinase